MRRSNLCCKLSLFLLIISFHFLGYSQSPQGFSYQAVVRDGTGKPIPSQTVGLRISLLNASLVPYYTETHTPKSSELGVISVVIGSGTPAAGSGAFSTVPWRNGDVLIKVEIDPAGGTAYTAMGNPTKLQSVPYALFAENAKEVVSQPTATEDEPIFVVKNKAGQIVFAVYQTGVRVYVEDSPIAKGAKGGFAVGGLSNQAKSGSAEYMRITSDSARIYINEATTKGTKGGFAVGGLSNQAKTLVSRNIMYVTPDSTRVYVNESVAKGAKGGFAVGGLSNQAKGSANNFLQLTPDNYFIGHESGSKTTTGLYNSFLGYQAGALNTSGLSNTYIGYQTGYSNQTGDNNVAVGNLAGYLSSAGLSNVFIGDSAGHGNTSSYNVFIGKGSGKFNTGQYNAFMGYQAGLKNTSGSSNVFIGNQTGFFNTIGSYNTFLGYQAGFKNNANYNTFTGYQSGKSNINGSYNVFSGYQSGINNIDGSSNVFIGHESGLNNTSGWSNNFIGQGAGYSNTTGTNGIFIGNDAGRSNTTASGNIFIGRNSGYDLTGSDPNIYWGNVFLGNLTGASMTTGSVNLIAGVNAGQYKTSGSNNVILGSNAGEYNAGGNSNVIIGAGAGAGSAINPTGSYNVFIGYNAGSSETGNNKLYIANSSSNPPLIYGDFSLQRVGINTITPGEALEVNGNVKATSFIATAAAGSFPYKYSTTLNMTVPDYVFDKLIEGKSNENPIYEMLNLTELRQYINKNRHLPRVPSRAEIEKDGAVNLQGLQMVTLEKVEEATLYILELEKITKDQQKQIEELKVKNKEIDLLKVELEAIKSMLKK